MDIKLFFSLLLTITPFIELRLGLPLAISYATENNISIFLMFGLILLLNLILIYAIFLFLDYVHVVLLRNSFYRKLVKKYLERMRSRIHSFEKRHKEIGFIALVIFVAIPLPGTGAYSGCLISWLLGLDRKKSIISIGAGVILAGLIVLLASLSLFSFFK